jgi:hypothetical protein
LLLTAHKVRTSCSPFCFADDVDLMDPRLFGGAARLARFENCSS